MESSNEDFQEQPVYQPVGIEHISPNSGRKKYIPDVSLSLKPVEEMLFDSIEQAKIFYKEYAKAGGFSIRKGSQYVSNGVIRTKYFVCTKEGSPTTKEVDTLAEGYKRKRERRKPSQRTNCGALIKLSYDNGKFRLKTFVEQHNHPFVAQDDIHFLSAARELTFTHKKIMNDLATMNIGPVKAFNIMRTTFGGFDKVGVLKSDCKNFKRKQNLYINEYDAEMTVQRLMSKKEYCPNFSCDYYTNPRGELMGLFWADEHSKRNYYVFGDVISFDATYRSNKYKMVFVPFTGIDNHNRNVTLGAALLGNETAESYVWLLRCFKTAFGYEPSVVVTDQDPAMKRAIEDVFPNSRHRLCMWHIMDKLSTKVGSTLCNKTDFKTRLCNIVWTDSITPAVFEKEWMSIMDDFQLSDHDWLKDIYQIRQSWIPAYYRDENMSGLMRTTSRSESENYFFGKFCNPNCTLFEFMTHFETALDQQRDEHQKNDHLCRYTRAELWSNFALEQQADEIYTRTIFFDVQFEIQAALHNCVPLGLSEVNGFTKFEIKDFEHLPASFHEVMIRKEDVTVFCSCKRYEQFGLLCRHIFKALHIGDIRVFPKQYITRRWTKDVVSNSVIRSSGFEYHNVDGSSDVYRVVREINLAHDHIINQVVVDREQLNIYIDYINQYKLKVDEISFNAPRPSRRDRFEELTGAPQPDQINIRAPIGVRTKGCGLPVRYRSAREQAISQAKFQKTQSKCKKCGEPGHDSRNHHKFYPEGLNFDAEISKDEENNQE